MDFSVIEALSPLLGTTSALLLVLLSIVWKDLVKTREKLWKSFQTINDNTAALKAVEKALEKQQLHLARQNTEMGQIKALLAEVKGLLQKHEGQ